MTHNRAKDLRAGEAALLHSARLMQFTIAGVNFIPLSELPERGALEPDTEVAYYNDPDLGIAWTQPPVAVSAKDENNPRLFEVQEELERVLS